MNEITAPGDGPGRLLQTITELARDKDFDVAKFKALAELQITMEDRQAERLLTRDLAAIKKRLPQVSKNGTIDLVKDGVRKGAVPFASYHDVMAVVQPLCDEFEMTISFTSRFDHDKLIVTAILRHPAGASVSADVPLPIDTGPGRNTTQAHGSSMSYGRRYAVEQLFNVIRKGKDDDGGMAHFKVLTEEQVTELAELLKTGGSSEAALLAHFYGDAYRSLEAAPAGDYGKLKQAIEARNRAAAAKKAKEGTV